MAKILIMEDEKPIRSLYAEMLKGVHQVDFAFTGQEGYDRALVVEYDLVIADLNMPSWSGADSLAVIDMLKPDQKFLIVSGFLAQRDFQETLATIPNVMGQVQKPFDKATLINAIQNALDQPPKKR